MHHPPLHPISGQSQGYVLDFSPGTKPQTDPSDETSAFKVDGDVLLGRQHVDTKDFPLSQTERKAGDRA